MIQSSLTERFDQKLSMSDDRPEILKEIFDMISEAPESGERDGLMALAYHEGIGVEADMDKCFEYAEKAAFEREDPLGYYILGYMCDNYETPDQAEGGPRQKYDHYDAERFYEKCCEKESKWKIPACHWLGDYFMDGAKGGDPEIGVEYYEKIAEKDADAAGKLSDYYWDIVIPDNTEDEYWTDPLFRWTKAAAELDPEEYTYRLGWLYADGIGCQKSFQLALKYFGEAYLHNDWRGAISSADILENYLNEHRELSDKDISSYKEMIDSWRKKGQDMKEKANSEEPDPSVEED